MYAVVAYPGKVTVAKVLAGVKRGGGYCRLRYCCLELLGRELFVEFQQEDKLEKLELTNLASMRVSNRIIPPSEVGPKDAPRDGLGSMEIVLANIAVCS